MIYFILWVVFLLVAIAAVPIAMTLENKARQGMAYDNGYDGDDAAAQGDSVEALDADDGDLQPLDDDADGFGQAEAVDDFGADPMGAGDDLGGADFGGDDFGDADFGGGELGDDDFGAFDEELK